MEKKIKLHDRTFEVMIPAEKIDAAVAKVADRLNADYSSSEQVPIFVSVLSGSFMFLADLVRKVEFNNEVAFVKISSYEGTQSTGCVKQQLGIDFDVTGRDLIIVEDIVETADHLCSVLAEYRGLRLGLRSDWPQSEGYLRCVE